MKIIDDTFYECRIITQRFEYLVQPPPGYSYVKDKRRRHTHQLSFDDMCKLLIEKCTNHPKWYMIENMLFKYI